MFVLEVSTNKRLKAIIAPIVESDYKALTRKRFFFNWKAEKVNAVYKLRIDKNADILGVISLSFIDDEQRIEIKLLAVSAENVGKGKQIDRIVGNLIAFACRMAIKKYGAAAAVSLVPKTLLRKYYISKYGMEEAGKQIFLFGHSLFKILKEYDNEQEEFGQ